MTILSTFGAGGDSTVDTGDIGHSLRFRRSASAYISTGVTTAATSTYFCFFKQGAIDAVNPIFDGNIKINANNTITAFGLTTSAVKRDPTSQHWIHVSNNGLVFDGVNLGAVTTSAITGLRIGYDGTNYADMYGARMCCVSGSSLAYTDFVYFNSTINEWVCKSQSAIKALVDAGGSASFMYDFDDASSLTTLGYDKSSKANNATLNNFSLTAGTTYDHMLDVPGNSFATLNPLDKLTSGGYITPTNGNLHVSSLGNNLSPSSQPIPSTGKWYAQAVLTTANFPEYGLASFNGRGGGSATGVMAIYNGNYLAEGSSGGTDGNYASASGDVAIIAVDADANKCWLGRWRSGTTVWLGGGDPAAGTSPTFSAGGGGGVYSTAFNAATYRWPFLATGAGSDVWDAMFGQAPLQASATYNSAAGGYFCGTPPTGFKALCQRNMPDPAILNPKNGFVSVLATEDNIYSTLASARSGWTDYVDVLKNRAASESWAWQFSHDSSSEYAVAASSLVRQTKRTQSGSNNWVGYSIRIGATYGTAAGSVSHTNGAATTVTHNVGKSARQLILLFNRAGGSAVPVYHPDLTSGELLDLCTTAADAASTAITSVGTNSFQIGSATATGTYDYLVCSEISQFFDLGKWTGNASADGVYYDAGHKPKMLYAKALSTTDDHRVYDDLRPGYNVQGGVVLANTNAAETTAAEMDITAFGMKARITTTPNAAQTYVTASWASSSGKYSLGR